MKILNVLNVSNLSNLQADSGYVFQKLLMKEILRQRPDWEYFFIVPKGAEHIDDRIQNIELEFGSNKYEVRFHFPWYDLKKRLETILPKVDLIHINQSEQTANFRALASSLLPSRRIPLVTYFHYLPIDPSRALGFSPEKYDSAAQMIVNSCSTNLSFDETLNLHNLALPIFMRQIEALMVADQSIICSEFGIDLLVGNAQKLVPDITPKITAIPPPISFEESEPGRSTVKDKNKVIVFNHRLYNHYGPKEFFNFMDSFYANVRTDFEVVITDPTFGRSSERNKLDSSFSSTREKLLNKPYVRLEHFKERSEYYRRLGGYKLSIGPFKPSALWSMSVVDTMACGVPVACPRYACFPELLGRDSPLLFSSLEELSQLIQRLLDDEDFYRNSSKECLTRVEKFKVEKTAYEFIKIFEELSRYEK
ncbi:hypothetical protein DRJ22_05575 [Candidatus Woesearchaeota archaeon]|nr:MAG: hypothetical protein DRJ22_05575 [Candidatus Woesearchaeota archaeon]